jgi:tRNA modification GTPase
VVVHLGVAREADAPEHAGGASNGQDLTDQGRAQVEVSVGAPAEALDEAIARRLPAGTPVLRVWNKIDLVSRAAHTDEQAVWLSARTGEGIGLLRAALLRLAGWQGAGEGLFMARERHLQALREAREHLTIAHAHAQRRDEVLDLFAEELRLAQEALNRITGEFGADDLLGVIFSRFCIGK